MFAPPVNPTSADGYQAKPPLGIVETRKTISGGSGNTMQSRADQRVAVVEIML